MPPLVSEGGGLGCESVGKADLLSDHFDGKQSREAVDLPFTCHPSPSLTTFASTFNLHIRKPKPQAGIKKKRYMNSINY